jgi:hypothetical protein
MRFSFVFLGDDEFNRDLSPINTVPPSGSVDEVRFADHLP